LIHCTRTFTSRHLQDLLQLGGPCSIVDSEVTVDKLLACMQVLLHDGTSVHLHVGPEFLRLLEVLVPWVDTTRDQVRRYLDLITLVAQGLSDREIGLRLHL